MAHEVYLDPITNLYRCFTVRRPAWHFEETRHKVFDEWPGREEAMEAAGHNFTVRTKAVYEEIEVEYTIGHRSIPGYHAVVREDTGVVLSVMPETYQPIQNEMMWNIVDALVSKPEVHYETGGTLRGGRRLWVMAWLDEPWQLEGDDSLTLPRLCVVTSHDGTRALEVMALVTRVVCENTYQAGRSEAIRCGYYYAFRHTANVQERLQQSDEALETVRRHFDMYKGLVQRLATVRLTNTQLEAFVNAFIPLPVHGEITKRTLEWIEGNRDKLRKIMAGVTIPEAHRNTGYGTWCAGVEYLDHIRAFRSSETYFTRTVEPSALKLELANLIFKL